MQKNFGLRLKTQLIILFIALLTVLMVSVMGITYQRVDQVIQEQSATLMQQYFDQNTYNLVSYAKEIDKVVLSLSQIPGVVSYMEEGWRNSSDIIMNVTQILDSSRKIINNYEEIESVFFFGEKGVTFSITPTRNILYLEEKKPNIYEGSRMQKQLMKVPWISFWTGGYKSTDFLIESDEKENPVNYITVARSVNYNTKHVGGVVVNINEKKLHELMLDAGEEQERKSFVINREGKIVIDWESEMLGEIYEMAELLSKQKSGDMIVDGEQINFRKIEGEKGMDWTLVSTVPLSVLYKNTTQLRNLFVKTFVLALALGLIAAVYFLYRLTKPLDQLRLAMHKMQKYDLGIQLEKRSKNELGQLGETFNKMSLNIEDMVNKIQKMEAEKRNLEENILQAQINPHFLFNTLSNIKYMAMIVQSNTIVDCITALGNILSPIYRSQQKEWTAQEEISYLQNYIKIMNYRFGGKIQVEYTVEQENKEAKLLRFILQPLLENSIIHGFETRGGEGKIWVSMRETDTLWNIQVKDNGEGMDVEELSKLNESVFEEEEMNGGKRHIGIRNVYKRLVAFYGENYGMHISSEKGTGTKISMYFPTNIRTSVETVRIEKEKQQKNS